MTLNVIVNNMVAVDSEVSHHGVRTTDNFEKSEVFTHPKYHGVLISNGNAYTHLQNVSFLREAHGESLDELMGALRDFHNGRWEDSYQKGLARIEQDIRDKCKLVPDEEKNKVIANRFAEEVEKLHAQMQQDARECGAFYIVAYDSEKGRLRKFQLPDQRRAYLGYVDFPIITAGSGGDLAGAYLSTQTSGIDWAGITSGYNFYLISLACAAATANAGVGGFMKIIIVDKDAVHGADPQMVNAAVRICGKQIAGDISKKTAIESIENLWNDLLPNYACLARKLHITESDLLYSPCSVHQDVSQFNARRQDS